MDKECIACADPSNQLKHGLCPRCRAIQRTAADRRRRRDSRRTGHRFKRREGIR
jgi:hypothetical protein